MLWLAVVIFFSAICPILLIPLMLIRMFMDKNGISAQTLFGVVVVIALAFVLIMSPIVTLISIVTEGVVDTINDSGILVGITIVEAIVLVFLFFRNKNVREKLHLSEISKEKRGRRPVIETNPIFGSLIIIFGMILCVWMMAQDDGITEMFSIFVGVGAVFLALHH